MSAFIVSPEHINVMIHAGLDRHGRCYLLTWCVPGSNPLQHRELTEQTADAAAQMLIEANTDSVNYRYNESSVCVQGYTPPRRTGWQQVEVLKAIRCYEYQSCEIPEWEQTEAHAFCRALEHWVIDTMPGWEEAAWGIEDDTKPWQPASRHAAG